MPTSNKPRKRTQHTKESSGSPNPDSKLPDRRAMESHLHNLGGRSAERALNKAQNLMYKA